MPWTAYGPLPTPGQGRWPPLTGPLKRCPPANGAGTQSAGRGAGIIQRSAASSAVFPRHVELATAARSFSAGGPCRHRRTGGPCWRACQTSTLACPCPEPRCSVRRPGHSKAPLLSGRSPLSTGSPIRGFSGRSCARRWTPNCSAGYCRFRGVSAGRRGACSGRSSPAGARGERKRPGRARAAEPGCRRQPLLNSWKS